MNTTLAKFMSLAVTAIVVAGLIFVAAIDLLKSEASENKNYIEENINTVIQSEMDTP